jgi:hypothetical protein
LKKPSQDELETMRDARCSSLIRRWLAGKKLPDSEKAEIAHIIPLEILNAGPSAPGSKEAVSKLRDTRKHAKYPKKLPEYAAFYGVTERTIKRLIRRGKETGKLPPLDEPDKMPAWWRVNMDHEVPDWLMGFQPADGNNRQSGVGSPDPRASSDDGRSNTTETGDKGPRDFSDVKSLDIAENVAALRQTHAINNRLLTDALNASDPSEQTIALRQRNYERSFELLRKAESTLIELQKQKGNLIDKETVRTELAQIFESLRLMRETMPHRIMVALEQILPRRFQRVFGALEKFLMPAIEKARADEENIFRNLETIRSPEDIEKALRAP